MISNNEFSSVSIENMVASENSVKNQLCPYKNESCKANYEAACDLTPTKKSSKSVILSKTEESKKSSKLPVESVCSSLKPFQNASSSEGLSPFHEVAVNEDSNDIVFEEQRTLRRLDYDSCNQKIISVPSILKPEVVEDKNKNKQSDLPFEKDNLIIHISKSPVLKCTDFAKSSLLKSKKNIMTDSYIPLSEEKENMELAERSQHQSITDLVSSKAFQKHDHNSDKRSSVSNPTVNF